MSCGACARIGTNDTGPKAHSPGCPNGPRTTGLERITVCRRIVKNHQHEEIDGVLVDVQTANAIVQVYDRLAEQKNRDDFKSRPIAEMGKLAWKVIAKATSR